MLKGALLFLANRRPVQRLIMRHDLLRGLANRYVAGEELADGILVAQTLNLQRLQVSLDYLGESVSSRADAARAVNNYLDAIAAIERERVDSHVSLKLTQLGLDVSRELSVVNLRTVLDRAREVNTNEGPLFVRVDMESSAYTDRILSVHEELWKQDYRNVGIVLQTYLRRTAADVEKAIAMGTRVRLCKGAYFEPPEIAFQDKAEVDASYARLMERLMLAGNYPALATHDERLIRHAQDFARKNHIEPSRFEFQMLYGIRRDLQLRLLQQGYTVRVYLPYGQEWYSYLVRRLAERPANVSFFLRSAVQEALARRANGRH
jgi:proline dehydrogenase